MRWRLTQRVDVDGVTVTIGENEGRFRVRWRSPDGPVVIGSEARGFLASADEALSRATAHLGGNPDPDVEPFDPLAPVKAAQGPAPSGIFTLPE